MFSNKVSLKLDKPKVFTVVSHIVSILSIFGLERVDQNAGKYIFKNNKFKLIFFGTLITFYAISYIVLSYQNAEQYSKSMLLLFINRLLPFLWVIFGLIILATMSWESNRDGRNFYETAEKADDFLYNFKSEEYRKQKLRYNVMYFSAVAFFVLNTVFQFYYSTAHLIGLGGSLIVTTLTLIGYYLTSICLVLSVSNLLMRMDFFRLRIKAFNEKVHVLLGSAPVTISRENIENLKMQKDSCGQIEKMISCYNFLYQHCDAINKRYGIQIVFLYTNLVTTNVGFAFTFISFVGGQIDDPIYYWSNVTNTVGLNIIAVLIVENVMSIKRNLKSVSLTAENLIIDTNMNERSRQKWMEYLSFSQRQPIDIAAIGFFELDYPLLAGILGITVTYTIVIMQMSTTG